MVTRRSLLKAAAAGSVAMAAQAVSPLRASAATQGGDILAWVSYDPAQLLPSFNAFMTWTSVVPGRVTFDAPASGAVLLGMAAAIKAGGGGQGYWRVVEADGNPVPGTEQLVTVTPVTLRVSSRVMVDGLEPGSPQDWTLQQRTTIAAAPISLLAGMGKTGLSYGPLTMVVIAA